MPRQTITLRDVDIPDGWEPTGEFRRPRIGEWFQAYYEGSEPFECKNNDSAILRVILRRKKEPEPMKSDIVNEPMDAPIKLRKANEERQREAAVEALPKVILQAFRGDGTKRDPKKCYLLKAKGSSWTVSQVSSDEVFNSELWYVELPPILDPPEPEPQLRQVPGWEVEIKHSRGFGGDYWWVAKVDGVSMVEQRGYSKTKRDAIDAWNKFSRDFLVGGKDGGA